MRRITLWTARRAGDSITIYGTDADTREAAKITGVTEISDKNGQTVARDKQENEYRLVT